LRRFAHRREVDNSGNAREILQKDARRKKRDFPFGARCSGLPCGEGANVFGMNKAAVFLAKEIFEQNFQRKWQARHLADTGALERVQAIDFVAVAARAE
jgi:hypothetical protein